VALDHGGAPLAAMVVVMVVVVVMMLADDLVVVVVMVMVALAMAVTMDSHAARTHVDVLREGCDRRQGQGRGGGVGE
jgi:hypothetical protein